MGGLTSDKFYGKIYYEKEDEDLHEIICERLSFISRMVAVHIVNYWRPTKDADPYDPNPSHISNHDLITIIEFLEHYETEEWAELFLLKFQHYINELKNTAGWTQMFKAWGDDPRKNDYRVTSRRVENSNLMFKDKKDYDEWFESQKQKDLLADALKERGIGYDPSATNYKHNVLKKLGKKKTNGVQL